MTTCTSICKYYSHRLYLLDVIKDPTFNVHNVHFPLKNARVPAKYYIIHALQRHNWLNVIESDEVSVRLNQKELFGSWNSLTFVETKKRPNYYLAQIWSFSPSRPDFYLLKLNGRGLFLLSTISRVLVRAKNAHS